MELTSWTFNREEFEKELNVTMSLTLRELVEDGILKKEKVTEFEETHTVVLLKNNSLLSKVSSWLFSNKEDKPNSWKILIVKLKKV